MIKNENRKVLVYILNHNYSKFLKRSIDSVLKQSYRNFNILIIDDGSIDASKNILKKYENLTNIKIIYQKKMGMIKSIINAVKNSRNEFFVRLDADDWLHKDYLKETMRAMEKNKNIALVFPDYFEVDQSNKLIKRIKRHKFNHKNILLDFPAHGACTLFRRKLFEQTSGYSSKIKAQDGFDIWLKIIKKFKVQNVSKPLFYYRQHQNNLTKNFRRILENRYQILENQSDRKNNSSTLAFIPILENESKKLLSFNKFKKQRLIDLTINKAKSSKKIFKIVVSTNNDILIKYIQKKYKRFSHKIKIHHRNEKKDKNLAYTLLDYFRNNDEKKIRNLAILTIEYPLTDKKELDAAINTINIFKANAVETVTSINSIFYYSSKNGLKIWGNKLLKKERDDIFIRKGGIMIINKKFFLKKKKLISLDKLAHLLIHPLSSLNYFELNDYKNFF